MPETSSAARAIRPSVPKSANNERLLLRLVAGGIIFALALAVVLLRLQRLAELPPGLNLDEGIHGVDALQVLQGKRAVFFPRNNGREGMIVNAVALAISVLGAHGVGCPSAYCPGQRGHGLRRLLVGAACSLGEMKGSMARHGGARRSRPPRGAVC